jgi:hypothetical protein
MTTGRPARSGRYKSASDDVRLRRLAPKTLVSTTTGDRLE